MYWIQKMCRLVAPVCWVLDKRCEKSVYRVSPLLSPAPPPAVAAGAQYCSLKALTDQISNPGFFPGSPSCPLSPWCGHTAPANNWISEMALQWLPCPLCDFPLFHTNEKTASPQFTRLKRSFLANLFIIFPTKKLCIWFHSLSYKIN